MTSHLAAGLLLCLSAVPWLAARESEIGGAECQRSCGGVDIPFPFGMGPDHCRLTPDFRITCQDVGNGVHKAPFLAMFDNVEVLSISLEQGEAQVMNPISSYCYNAESGKMESDEWRWTLDNTPYTFSSAANKFRVVGCRALAYIGNTNGSASAKYQTGCVAMCFQGNMDLDSCSGMGCCQMAIPKGLKYYEVWFDQSLNISGIDDGEDLFGRCSFAVLMKDSSNFRLPWSNFSNISTGFNASLGGKAPVVLEWSIGQDDDCSTAATKPGHACVSTNSMCYNATSGPGYICKCRQGFQGNPYLRNGCQDIDECLLPDKYPCFGVCENTVGSFACHCLPGTGGNASIRGGCQKDPFPRRARIATGISVGLVVALVAFLSAQVFLNKESKKRQGYFEQHGGQMLLQILKTEGNNIAFTLYDRGDLVKATGGFHKDNVIGEGAHGTVYKAILSSATVAVKRCTKIDKTRTDEFVRELVVLCRVSHPNVVRLLGCCLYFEAPMLVYEFVPNGTLSHLLHGRPRRPVTLPTRLRIAAETAEALAHLHSPPYPTLHGDIKPDNILLGKECIAKVSDFGCSTINDNVQVVPKGTLAYLDPEFLKDRQITEKTDVYSFGVVLIELLTRKNPVDKECKNLTVMFQDSIGNGTLGDLLDTDIVKEGSMELIYAAAKLVGRCIAAPGNARPTMGQVAKELRQFSDKMPESSEAQVQLEVQDDRYSCTGTDGENTGFSNLPALSTELAR